MMESSHQSDWETYRAIVLAKEGTELLLAPTVAGFLLPSVQIPRRERLAENLTVAVKSEWGQRVISLWTMDLHDPLSAHDHKYNYEVLECYAAGEAHPSAQWVDASSL
jgi:hypothetical protein